jgi:hypothetical protein
LHESHELFQFPAQQNQVGRKFGAVNIELTTSDLNEIDAATSSIEIEVARYSDQHERLTGR